MTLNETPNHPGSERLQDLVEDTLDQAERAVLESHLATCALCRSEVDELRTLFEMLSEMPELAPSAAFADRVMARVRVPRPAFSWSREWARRLTPQTTPAWAFATALFALPLVGISAFVWWLVSQPGVSAQGLWLVASGLVQDGVATGSQWIWGRLAGSTLAGWTSSALDLLETTGRGEIGLAFVMFATLTAASIWVLYKNLFRTEARRTDYASFVF
jgi:anti-sigma factor RsiW